MRYCSRWILRKIHHTKHLSMNRETRSVFKFFFIYTQHRVGTDRRGGFFFFPNNNLFSRHEASAFYFLCVSTVVKKRERSVVRVKWISDPPFFRYDRNIVVEFAWKRQSWNFSEKTSYTSANAFINRKTSRRIRSLHRILTTKMSVGKNTNVLSIFMFTVAL